jgi:hypothetical protein
MKNKCPWKITRQRIVQRCNNTNNTGYRYYGAKGIKNKLSTDDLKVLWFRDKAYLMKEPSIDRLDSKGNYEFSNCRYIELRLNCGTGDRGRGGEKKYLRKPVDIFSIDGKKLVMSFDSIKAASKALKVNPSSGTMHLSGNSKSCGGYKWKLRKKSKQKE